MKFTLRDIIISDAVKGMVGMSNQDIVDFLNKCKGIITTCTEVQMHRPL